MFPLSDSVISDKVGDSTAEAPDDGVEREVAARAAEVAVGAAAAAELRLLAAVRDRGCWPASRPSARLVLLTRPLT